MNKQPDIEQVIEVLHRLDVAAGWIGEGSDIIGELVKWVDGDDDQIATWALSLCPVCGLGPERKPPHAQWCSHRARKTGA